MKIRSFAPILAAATTAWAAACGPDPVNPASGKAPGWPSGGTQPTEGESSDWTAIATGTVIPGQPDHYGTYTKPASLPTGNSPPPFQRGSWPSWGCTSDDAKSNPGAPNGPDHRGCWGGGFDINSPPNTWPDTGNICRYEFTMQNVTLSPDGTPREMITVNGQYPGPLVECNWGDTIEVSVTNGLQYNGTGIHWHGFRQEGTCEMDGVPGVTECPLAPGDSKTYRFKATSYGTTWYHSHFSTQYGDGVKGPVIIHGPASMNYDIDLGTVMLDEIYPLTVTQESYFALIQGPPQASNVLFNGQNIKPDLSAGQRQTFTFTPGKKHLIRLINSAVDSMFAVQIDNHNLTVISNDFVPINPYNTTSLSIGIGQRYDIVVEANQSVDSYWFRAIPQQGANPGPLPGAGAQQPVTSANPGGSSTSAPPPATSTSIKRRQASGPGGPGGQPGGAPQGCCSNVNTGLGTANAIIQYEGASDALPTTNYTAFSISCTDEPIASLVPVVTKSVDSSQFAAAESSLPVNLGATVNNGQRLNTWYLNGISLDIDWSHPTLSQVVSGNDSFPTIRDVVILTESNVWTYWVIQNQFFAPHPMHLHGHDFSLLGQGNGTFDPSSMIDLLNFDNPTRRDVAMLPAQGWTVIAFETDNPGAWLMHCHIAWHVAEGLALQFLEVPSQIPTVYSSAVQTQDYQDTCSSWTSWFATDSVYNKTDAGLRRRNPVNYALPQNHRLDVTRHVNAHKHKLRARFPHEY